MDGVLRYPPVSTSVLVVRGRPCGYITALKCWRKGLNVYIVKKANKVIVVSKYTLGYINSRIIKLI